MAEKIQTAETAFHYVNSFRSFEEFVFAGSLSVILFAASDPQMALDKDVLRYTNGAFVLVAGLEVLHPKSNKNMSALARTVRVGIMAMGFFAGQVVVDSVFEEEVANPVPYWQAQR